MVKVFVDGVVKMEYGTQGEETALRQAAALKRLEPTKKIEVVRNNGERIG